MKGFKERGDHGSRQTNDCSFLFRLGGRRNNAMKEIILKYERSAGRGFGMDLLDDSSKERVEKLFLLNFRRIKSVAGETMLMCSSRFDRE